MANEQQRHDMSDKVWNLLEPHLPGQRGQWGGIAKDNRWFLEGGSGVCEQKHRGGICRYVTGTGGRCINSFADGVTKALGKNCWKFWWMNPILNG